MKRRRIPMVTIDDEFIVTVNPDGLHVIPAPEGGHLEFDDAMTGPGVVYPYPLAGPDDPDTDCDEEQL